MPRSFLIRKILGLDDGNYTNDDHLHDNGNSRKTIYSDDIVKIVSQGEKKVSSFKENVHKGHSVGIRRDRSFQCFRADGSQRNCDFCQNGAFHLCHSNKLLLSRGKERLKIDFSSTIPSDKDTLVTNKSCVDSESDQRFSCTSCDMYFSRPSDLQRHLLIHMKTKPYTCEVCDRGFTWFGNFQKHMLSHKEKTAGLTSLIDSPQMKEEDLVVKEGKLFKCRLCLKSFTRMSGLRTHIRMHTGQRPFKCTECSFAFTTSRALKMHLRIHTGEKPYKCEDCPKAFTRRDELQAHIYMHKGEKPFKCDECPSAFIRYGHLQRHKLIHSNDKPYKCKYCAKSFTQYRNLQTHTFKHTGERPFKCSYCAKGFTQYGTLQAHERIHTGQKPFSCDHCDRFFITSSHLRWHVKRHH